RLRPPRKRSAHTGKPSQTFQNSTRAEAMTTTQNDSPSHDDDDSIDITDLAGLCGLRQDDILEYHRLRIVSLRSTDGTYRAGVHTLSRLRHISILQDEHGMKPASIGFVLNLMDRLDAAERELRSLRERL